MDAICRTRTNQRDAVSPRRASLHVLRAEVRHAPLDPRPCFPVISGRKGHLDQRGHGLPLSCNTRKGARTPEEANMPLLAVPYAPNPHEYLYLLRGRRILADQMDFLRSGFRNLKM